MFRLDATDTQRIVVSTIGAVILSATCLIAAAGPLRAEGVADRPSSFVLAQVQGDAGSEASLAPRPGALFA
jgi:hypothetical protein